MAVRGLWRSLREEIEKLDAPTGARNELHSECTHHILSHRLVPLSDSLEADRMRPDAGKAEATSYLEVARIDG